VLQCCRVVVIVGISMLLLILGDTIEEDRHGYPMIHSIGDMITITQSIERYHGITHNSIISTHVQIP